MVRAHERLTDDTARAVRNGSGRRYRLGEAAGHGPGGHGPVLAAQVLLRLLIGRLLVRIQSREPIYKLLTCRNVAVGAFVGFGQTGPR